MLPDYKICIEVILNSILDYFLTFWSEDVSSCDTDFMRFLFYFSREKYLTAK